MDVALSISSHVISILLSLSLLLYIHRTVHVVSLPLRIGRRIQCLVIAFGFYMSAQAIDPYNDWLNEGRVLISQFLACIFIVFDWTILIRFAPASHRAFTPKEQWRGYAVIGCMYGLTSVPSIIDRILYFSGQFSEVATLVGGMSHLLFGCLGVAFDIYTNVSVTRSLKSYAKLKQHFATRQESQEVQRGISFQLFSFMPRLMICIDLLGLGSGLVAVAFPQWVELGTHIAISLVCVHLTCQLFFFCILIEALKSLVHAKELSEVLESRADVIIGAHMMEANLGESSTKAVPTLTLGVAGMQANGVNIIPMKL